MAQPNGRQRVSASADGQPRGRASPSVSLLEVEPELGPLLTGEELGQAGRFALPARTVRRGTSVIGALEQTGAFGAIVLDGLLLHGTQIGNRPALRVVGPADIVPFTGSGAAIPLATVSVRAATRSRIALLDSHLLVATKRWPQLAALMYRRAVESSEGLATQLAISHLSRVDERLMALMWLLADRWGHVTASGVRLRLALTHDALGQLVGAQRPTVTLALRGLAERGALIRQDEDWMILHPPPESQAVELQPPRLLDLPRPGGGSAWRPPVQSEPPQDGRLARLQAELARLRQEFAPVRPLARDLTDQAKQLRTRAHELVEDAHALSLVADEARVAGRSAPRAR